jgi:putative oxidoreductase
MATSVPSQQAARSRAVPHEALRWVVPVGRALFAAIFILASFGHFSSSTISHAASSGVPLPNIAVPVSGLLALAGGLSVLLGYRARLGAALLIVFLAPVTLMMHRFWALPDPMMAKMQQVMFMKNVSMTGAALLIAYFGAGPISFDAHSAGRSN